MAKKTKIVVTIGPATESEAVMTDLIKAGLNVARFNTKHSDPPWHNERIQRVKSVAQNMGETIAILLDLQGPEIRIDLPNGEPFSVEKDEHIFLTNHDSTKAQQAKTILAPKEVAEGLQVGSHILLEDGACEFEVISKQDDVVELSAVLACTVKHRKTLNTPGLVLDMPSLTDRDYQYLDGVDLKLVDFVGLSFVRNPADIADLRRELDQRGSSAHIVAKIENQTALDNLDELIEAADAVMVARGDLGVEVAYQELIHWQRTIITKCRQAAKPVITATEMLKSMVEKSRPTRAEVSDVAHSIYDGTDAVMLSDETTIGKYPVKAVEVQAKIAEFNEPYVRDVDLDYDLSSPTSAITHSALEIVRQSGLNISKIVCLSDTGRTARILASYHPSVPIHVLTQNHQTLSKLQLLYNVTTHLMDMPEASKTMPDAWLERCKAESILSAGETIVFIYGATWKQPGLINSLSIVTIS